MHWSRVAFVTAVVLGTGSAVRATEIPAVYVNPYFTARQPSATSVQASAVNRNLPSHPIAALGTAVRVQKLNEAFPAGNGSTLATSRSDRQSAVADSRAPRLLPNDPHAKPIASRSDAPTLIETLRRDAQVVTAAFTVEAPASSAASAWPTTQLPASANSTSDAEPLTSPGGNPLRRPASSAVIGNPLR